MTILHIDSSINGENSVSRVLTRSIVDQLRAADPKADVIVRDLAERAAAAPDARGVRRLVDASTSSSLPTPW